MIEICQIKTTWLWPGAAVIHAKFSGKSRKKIYTHFLPENHAKIMPEIYAQIKNSRYLQLYFQHFQFCSKQQTI